MSPTASRTDPPTASRWTVLRCQWPSMVRACVAWPLSSATKLYGPGVKVIRPRAILYSVSATVTVVPPATELLPDAVDGAEVSGVVAPPEEPVAAVGTTTGGGQRDGSDTEDEPARMGQMRCCP